MPDLAKKQCVDAVHSETNVLSSDPFGIPYEALVVSVTDKGWARGIDLTALTGRTGQKVVMKPVRLTGLRTANEDSMISAF